MTSIIGYLNNKTVYLASSLASEYCGIRKTERFRDNYPIRRLRNGVLLGFVGNRALKQIIFANSRIFNLDKNKKLSKEHIVCEIIPRLYGLIKSNNTGIAKSNCDEFEGTIIIAYKDMMYKIYGDFVVVRSTDYVSVGKEASFFKPYLTGIDKNKNIEEQLIGCLNNASINTDCIRPPYITINTTCLEFNLVEE